MEKEQFVVLHIYAKTDPCAPKISWISIATVETFDSLEAARSFHSQLVRGWMSDIIYETDLDDFELSIQYNEDEVKIACPKANFIDFFRIERKEQ